MNNDRLQELFESGRAPEWDDLSAESVLEWIQEVVPGAYEAAKSVYQAQQDDH